MKNLPSQVFGSIAADLNSLATHSSGWAGAGILARRTGCQVPSRIHGLRHQFKRLLSELQEVGGDNARHDAQHFESGRPARQSAANGADHPQSAPSMAESSDGRMQALQVMGQIAEQQTQQLMKLRQIMLVGPSEQTGVSGGDHSATGVRACRDRAVLQTQSCVRRWTGISVRASTEWRERVKKLISGAVAVGLLVCAACTRLNPEARSSQHAEKAGSGELTAVQPRNRSSSGWDAIGRSRLRSRTCASRCVSPPRRNGVTRPKGGCAPPRTSWPFFVRLPRRAMAVSFGRA